MLEDVRVVVQSGVLSSDRQIAIGMLIDNSGRFTSQEGPLWDFKRDWPFSYSDEYFGAIAKEICGFANASGGLLIFGVHDETREAGHNKVTPNMDRFKQALDQLLTTKVDLLFQRYDTGKSTAVDVLLVRPIKPSEMPTKLNKQLGKSQPGTIYIRDGHEVVAAEPRHVPMLYCRNSAEAGSEENVIGLLPPSPARIRRFIGRLETIDKIFHWLKMSDEPRTFFYGKGGSGKTTIAYQVAKTISSTGANIWLSGGERLDNVIYLSAKELSLNTETSTQEGFVGLDFSSENELYSSILSLGNWTNAEISSLDVADLRKEIKDFFDLTSNLIVIDDIDTLTTKGLEAGFDFLYGVLWRAKRRSKVLYTLRNAPSHSLSNSIEVPGLDPGKEYSEFVATCCEQFKATPPDGKFRDERLAIVSERRPLVIESIIALSRRAGSYERAVQLFEQNSGDDVRAYVFQREWDALPANNYGRYILAVLSLYGEPLEFADLAALTRFDDSRVTEGIGNIREMFLVINNVGSEAAYTLGNLTRAFLVNECRKLDHFAALKERVTLYKSNIYPENPQLTRLKQRVETLISRSYRDNDEGPLQQAWQVVIDAGLPVKVTEDPRFLSLQGDVACRQKRVLLEDARRCFTNAMQMGSEPEIDHLRRWFYAERDSGYGVEQCRQIAKFVQAGKRYAATEKLEFLSRNAAVLYNIGRENRFFDASRTIELWVEALEGHLVCFNAEVRGDVGSIGRSEEYSRNTCYNLFDLTVGAADKNDLFQTLSRISLYRVKYLDPIEEPLDRLLRMLSETKGARGDLQKIRGRLDASGRELCQKSRWLTSTTHLRVEMSFRVAQEKLRTAIGTS